VSDAELLERIQLHDADAFDALWDRHAPYVNGVCYHFLRSREESEDVLHEIFTAIWDNRIGYQAGRSSLTSWLFFMAKSRCLDRLKASHRRLPHDGIPDELAAPNDTNPEDGAAFSQRRTAVVTALDALPAEQREAIVTCFFKAVTYQEAAQQLGIPPGTLKSRVRLAMRKLSTILADLEADA